MTTKPQSTEPLLPCPFCGAAPKLIEIPVEVHYYVMCIECGACGSDLHGREDAIKAWNTRAPASTAPVVDEQWVKLLAKAISTAKPTLMPERDNLTHYVISPEAFAALAQVHRAIAKRLWGAAATAEQSLDEATMDWALSELADGWIQNNEREGPHGFYQNARRVLNAIVNRT